MAFAAELRASCEFSNISVSVEGEKFNLHLFPLLARSKYFQGLVRSSNKGESPAVTLVDLPGGVKAMELVADFCYDINIAPRINCENVGPLICAASYLQMIGKNNLMDVASEKLRDLINESALNCLESLKGCCDTAANAESEGIIEQCTAALARHWTKIRWEFNTISYKEITLLPDLPLKWMPILLSKMKQSKSNPKVSAEVVMTVVSWKADERLLESFNDKRVLESFIETEVESTDLREDDGRETAIADLQPRLASVFDAVIEYIPHPSLLERELEKDFSFVMQNWADKPLLPFGTRLWYCKALHFADQYELISYSKLLQCCSFLQSSLTVDQCKTFPPDLMKSVNITSYDALSNKTQNKIICALNDKYLLFHSKQGTINGSGFLSVMNSVSKFRDPASSFDGPFKAFEALLHSVTLSKEETEEISSSIDFANEFLQRAASNDRIPRENVLVCLVPSYQKLRHDLSESRANADKTAVRLVGVEQRLTQLEQGNRVWEDNYRQLQESYDVLQKEHEKLEKEYKTLKERTRYGRYY